MRAGLALALVCAVGCGDRAPAPAASPFRDPEGRSVAVTRLPATRIVSTMQSATEWLVALGAGHTLVARTDYDRQLELAALPSIGGGLDVGAEAVVALRPDVVLGWRIRASVDLARALGPFGIPVVAVEATDTAEAFAQLHTLAVLVGREEAASRLADSLRAELARLHALHCPAGRPPETALLVLSLEPAMAAGGGTWMGELAEAACLRNLFGDLDTPWGEVSLEAITARNPRWIVTGRGGDEAPLPPLATLPGWRDLEAVRAGRIIAIPGDLYSRLGPTMADWVRAIGDERARLEARPD